MANTSLGKVIERIINRIKKEEKKPVKGTSLDTPPTSIASPAPPTLFIPEKIYLKASSLHSLNDLDKVRSEVESGNIMIIRVGPLAERNVEDVKRAIGELCEFTEQVGGDIARLGEERVVITPSFVRIWREKTAESESESSTEVE